MMYKFIAGALFTSVVFFSKAYATSAIVANTLFGGLPTNHNYNLWGSSPSSTCNGYQGGHAGIDIQTQSRGAEIFYATMPGKVVSTNASNANGVAVYNSENDITAIYLHASTTLVNVGDNVVVGTPIGKQGCAGQCFGPHVHLEYRTGQRTSASCGISGTLDPISTSLKFINATQTSTLPPRFDGVGSLVDPISSTGCRDGCKQDSIKLHSHADSNQRSTGVFQVYKIAGVCASIELSGGLSNADIEVRPWDGYGTNSKFYRAKSIPATIPLSESSWSLISVTTTAPIEKDGFRYVTAKCLPSTPNPYDQNIEIVTTSTPLGFDSDFYWGGNGSLISHSTNQQQVVYGRSKDLAKLLRDKKTLSAFQIQTSKCPSVNINAGGIPFQVSWKQWDAPTWTDDSNLYTNVNHTFGNGPWWLLKIKSDKTNSNGSQVTVSCL